MSENLEGMFDLDIRMHEIGEEEPDEQSTRILEALRMGFLHGSHPSMHFRDDPSGMTYLDGEFDLGFIAKVIRAALR